MRFVAIILLAVSILMACAHRPVQQDLPRSEGNSVDHSGRRNLTVESSPNAASAPYELQFLDTIIAQHQAVIDMAQLAQTRAGNDGLKSFARTVIAEHQAEVAEMRGLREKYFSGADPAVNIDLPGARDTFAAIDLEKLHDLKEKPFDTEFIHELVQTFETSIRLANDAVSHKSADADNSERSASVRELAERLVDRRSQAITQLHVLQAP